MIIRSLIVCSQPLPYLMSILISSLDQVFKPPWIHEQHSVPLVAFQAEDQPNTASKKLSNLPCLAAFDTDSYPIRIDNHSSYCVTNNKHDFIGNLQPFHASIKGIGGSVSVKQKGTVAWSWEDDNGQVTTHHIADTLYMPSSPDRILSPQHWSQDRVAFNDDTAHAITNHSNIQLVWNGGEYTKTVPLNPTTNVAIMYSTSKFNKALDAFPAFVSDDEQSDDEDEDTTEVPINKPVAQPAPDPKTVTNGPEGVSDDIIRRPRPITFESPTKEPTIVPNDELMLEETNSPQQLFMHWHHRLNHLSYRRMFKMIDAGLLPSSLAKVRPPKCSSCMLGRATRRPWRTKAQPTKQTAPTINAPGDCVSVDQLQSTTPGLIGQMRGFVTKERYHYATVFVDHYSSLGFVYLQKTSNMKETLQAKEAFELYSAIRGVSISHYHADNGRFAEAGWMNHVKEKGQTITFCGTNAHHQNGVAEKRIRDLQEAARTALIHAKQRWPNAIESNLWPYALRCANHAHNYTISNKSDRLPINLFSQVEEVNTTRHFHTFGCPAYVLDPELQSGKLRPRHKWEDRARVSINLGPSPQHGKSVHLLLNTQTGRVTPQFHVVFDDSFDTTRNHSHVRLPVSLWQRRTHFQAPIPQSLTHDIKRNYLHAPPPSNIESVPIEEPIVDPNHNTTQQQATAPQPTMIEPAVAPAHQSTSTTRSGRTVRPPERLLHVMTNIANYDGTQELLYQDLHPLLLYKATTNPDILYMDQALNSPDREEFIKAMIKEVRDHESRGHWKLIPQSDVPPGHKILPAVWSMARKREMLTGHVYKWKSRLNLGGHKMEHGIDYDLTFAPVVAWPTIRLFMIYFIIKGWPTRQLDLVLAYPHAKVTRPTFMHIPRGFYFPGTTQRHVLQIIYNLYGGKDAGRIYFLFMRDYLVKIGFVQNPSDPCIFFYKQVVLMMYVDDFIIGGPTDQAIDDAIELIKDNADVEDKGDISDYVGVHVEKLDNNTLKLSQPHLIKSILDDLRIELISKSVETPALSGVILHADLFGEPHDNHFKYRSIIGKLNYLAKSTRPDIEYAVHQCARFMANPRRSHAQAIKRIARYLLATRDRGLILHPDPELSLDCYVDSSFCGEWIKSNADQAMYDPNTARSRTGYVINYAGCPLVWASRLQTEVCLSSTESELVAMSAATREVIYLLRVIKDAKEVAQLDLRLLHSRIICRVFEDNQGTIAIAKEYRVRPRTKHINVKYWHFTKFMEQHNNILRIHWIKSEDQIADIFTKPLGVALHNKFTINILGWNHEDEIRNQAEHQQST